MKKNAEKEILDQSENENTSAEKKERKKLSFKDMTFYKTKKFYVILVIVFSVLLIADIAFGTFARINSALSSFSQFGSMAGFSSAVTADADTDADSGDTDSDDTSSDSSDSSSFASSLPDMSSGDMSDADTSGLPSGDSVPDMSDISDSSSDSSGSFDISGVPSGGMTMDDAADDAFSDSSSDDASSEDSSEVSGGSEDSFADADISDLSSQTASSGGFIRWFASAYMIIALILLVLDIASIVMLIIVSKQNKRSAKAALKAQAEQEGRIYIERGPAKKEKDAKTSWIIPAAVVIAIILVVNLISSGSSTATAQTEASDLSGTVESGTIETTVPGTGTLEAEDSVQISFADGVEITKWYVANGDTVSEGDLIARVDKTSVLSAIASVQDAIDTIDEEIAEHEDDEISDTITATASGRVKAVYAAEEETVASVMYSYGSLIVISLDGLMAVDIETDDLSAGDTVTVTFSDGTQEEGTVESTVNGTAVITLTDEGTEIDDTVTVTDEDGSEIGEGTLYVHSALNITGFSGTIESISVSEEDEVDSGDTLITLTDTDYTAEYDALVETRTELSDMMAELFVLYETGCLYATASGTISGVDEDLLVSDSDDEDSSSDESADTEENTSDTVGITILTDGEDTSDETEDTDTDADTAEEESTSDDSSSDETAQDSASDETQGSDQSGQSSEDSSEDLSTGLDPSGSEETGQSGSEDTSSGTASDQSTDAAGSSDMTLSSGSTSDMSTLAASSDASSSESADTAQVISTTYGVSETVLCTITPQDYMTVEITVDETDILSIEVGQSATVTLDAYTGQSFEGEVISVSLSPENSGGNSKYTAVIRIERTQDMLAGMNASVSIVTDTSQDILIVPAAALFEEDGVTYIYTAFSEKSGEYSGAVEVETGISDGEYVEIVSGLEEGDTYYYSYLDTVNYSTTTVTGSGSMINFGSFMQ